MKPQYGSYFKVEIEKGLLIKEHWWKFVTRSLKISAIFSYRTYFSDVYISNKELLQLFMAFAIVHF